MKNVKKFPIIERRSQPQRLLWVAPVEQYFSPQNGMPMERRKDRDGIQAAQQIGDLLASGVGTGMVFGILKRDGRIELGATGCLMDHPLLGAGMTSVLQAMMDGWRLHPSVYLRPEWMDES